MFTYGNNQVGLAKNKIISLFKQSVLSNVRKGDEVRKGGKLDWNIWLEGCPDDVEPDSYHL